MKHSLSCGKPAILFGREHSGLTNQELERCHYLLHIPCNPEYSSLNVASAVQVVAYEIRKTALVSFPAQAQAQARLASALEMESFFAHLQATLLDLQFLHARKPSSSILRRLRRIFNRAQLETTEIHLLRGILSVIGLRLRGRIHDDEDKT